MAREHLAAGKYDSTKVAPYLTRTRALLFAFDVNNKSNHSAKHNYKCEQVTVCNHWHQLPSFSVRQLT